METFQWVALEKLSDIELAGRGTGRAAGFSPPAGYPDAAGEHTAANAFEAEANPATVEWLLTLAQAGPGGPVEPETPFRRARWPFGRTTSDGEVTVRALLSRGIPAIPSRWAVGSAGAPSSPLDRRFADAEPAEALQDREHASAGYLEPELPAADPLPTTAPLPAAALLEPELEERLEPELDDTGEMSQAGLETIELEDAADSGDATSSTLLARVSAYATLGADLPELPSPDPA